MPGNEEKSIGELVSKLTQQVKTLFRQEMDLFAAEMKEKVKQVAKDAIALTVGGAMLYFGFLVLLAAMVLGLATVMPAWGAALIIAALFLLVGFALVQKGRKDLKQMEMKPEQTTESIKETAQWAKTLRPQTSSPHRTGFAKTFGSRRAV